MVTTNRANQPGAGTFNCGVTNCTVVANVGIGVWSGDAAAVNSIIYHNTGGNFANVKTIYYCCTFPGGLLGGTTNAPLFVNEAAGDFHLQSNSPCINSGNNAYVVVTNDYDGNPRVVGGMVDIGAYEYPNPASVISYAWLQQYGLPTDGSADYLDLDGTGMNNWQKWIADLNPTNPASVFTQRAPNRNGVLAGIVVTWKSVTTRTYFIERATNLAPPVFTIVRSNIFGLTGTTSATDTTATNASPYFYRVGVQR
jgi:hypothetical protein